MKKDWSHLEEFRIRKGQFASLPGEHFGAFQIPTSQNVGFIIVCTDAEDELSEGWEHVSVRAVFLDNREQRGRIPKWVEMQWIKDIFWEEDECVVQFHPPKKDYVNVHPHVLHLWKYTKSELPRPSSKFVG